MPTGVAGVFEDAVWLVPGGLAGVVTLLMLWRSTRYVRAGTGSDGSIRMRVWVAYILRLGLVASVLALAALQGTGPLLWTFGGLMGSRWAVLVCWRAGLASSLSHRSQT